MNSAYPGDAVAYIVVGHAWFAMAVALSFGYTTLLRAIGSDLAPRNWWHTGLLLLSLAVQIVIAVIGVAAWLGRTPFAFDAYAGWVSVPAGLLALLSVPLYPWSPKKIGYVREIVSFTATVVGVLTSLALVAHALVD